VLQQNWLVEHTSLSRTLEHKGTFQRCMQSLSGCSHCSLGCIFENTFRVSNAVILNSKCVLAFPSNTYKSRLRYYKLMKFVARDFGLCFIPMPDPCEEEAVTLRDGIDEMSAAFGLDPDEVRRR